MQCTRRSIGLTVTAAALGLGACLSPPVQTPTTTVNQETGVRVEQNIKDKVDILFMVDDSPSMSPKQQELKNRFPQLISILDQFAAAGNKAWYHIGVVTSDLGANSYNIPGACYPLPDPPGQPNQAGHNRGAKLVAKGFAAASTCVPPTGNLNFIDYNQITGTNNLPPGQTLAQTFTCMATVGDRGCGLEHQLEAVYRALHDNIPENQGFLRSDAILAVVLVTDEDDCSAPDTIGGVPNNLFDPFQSSDPPPHYAGLYNGPYGPLLSYRCTEFGIMCGPQTPKRDTGYVQSGGPLPSSVCESMHDMSGARPGEPVSKLWDIKKYINYFTQPKVNGGVKDNPDDVILATISAPPDPLSIIFANITSGLGGTPGPYTECAALQTNPSMPNYCTVTLQHSCIAATNPSFFGDPAVRITQVVKAARHNVVKSICDTDYSQAIQAIGNQIVTQVGAACIKAPLPDPANPDCVVEDHTFNPMTGGQTATEIPQCSRSGGAKPCWNLVNNPNCPPITYQGQTQQFSVSIDRPPSGPPPGTTATVSCATVAPIGR